MNGGAWLADRFAISNASDIFTLALTVVLIALGSYTLRAVVIAITRWLGVYHPAYYRYWPRTGLRLALRVWINITHWWEKVRHMGKRSTAGFASVRAAMTLLYTPTKLHLGRLYAFGFGLQQPVGIEMARHLFMYAMTGGGKTTALVTIISAWQGSVFIIDPKRQVTHALQHHDARTWVVIEPYGKDSASFNVFDCIKNAMARFGDDSAVLWAFRVAEALIVTPSGSRTPFFTDTARGFLAALVLHVLSTHDESEHNLSFVRKRMVNGYRVFDDEGKEVETTEDERHELLYRAMADNPAFNGTISGGVAAIKNAAGETAGNVRSTLLEQTKWLDIPQVAGVLLNTDLLLGDLKTRNDVVMSFAAPVLSIREELAPLSRLLTNMLSYTFQDEPNKNGQCLTVIDELPAQGHNATLEVVIPVARSQGMSVLGIAQNIELMRNAYPKTYNIFTGEADAVLWAGINHKETAKHLSELLGKTTLIETDDYTGNQSYREVDVLSEDQVKRFLAPDSHNLIVTRAGARALRLKNEPYFKALPVWAYAPDPDHREPLPRRLMRRLLDPHINPDSGATHE